MEQIEREIRTWNFKKLISVVLILVIGVLLYYIVIINIDIQMSIGKDSIEERDFVWINKNDGLGGGWITDIAIDPENPKYIYATTPQGIFKSEDSGKTWKWIETTFPSLYLSCISIDSKDTSVIYIGGLSVLYKSMDRGKTWEWIHKNIPGGWIKAIAIDPKNSSIVYVAVHNNGIFKSIDGGKNWKKIFNKSYDMNFFETIAIDPLKPDIIFIGGDKGIYRSIDGGMKWEKLEIDEQIDTMNVSKIVIDPQNSNNVYVGTFGNWIYKSINKGETWELVNQNLDECSINCVEINPIDTSIVYAGGASNGIFKSDNKGKFWKEINDGLGNMRILSIAVNPKNPEDVFAGTYNGIFKSENGGESWFKIAKEVDRNNIYINKIVSDPHNKDVLYACGSSIFKSENGGNSWIRIDGSLVATEVFDFVIDPNPPSYLYFATNNKLYGSIDGGKNWTQLNPYLSHGHIGSIAINPIDSSIYFVSHERIFKSENFGKTWIKLSDISNDTTGWSNFILIAPTNTNVLYVCRYGGYEPGLYRSLDKGRSWERMKDLNKYNVRKVYIDPNNSKIMYVLTWGDGIFKSEDGGINWYQINEGQTSCCMHDLYIDSENSNNLYLATHIEGVFKSVNSGKSWENISKNLNNGDVYSVLYIPGSIKSNNFPIVYAGTNGGGISKLVYLPTPPTITSIREENSYIKIEWTLSKKGTNKILGYAIYRSINGSPYEKIGEVDYNTNFYIDQNVQPNNLYQYYVKAFDSEIPRVYSLPSNIKNPQKNEGRISLKKLIHNYEIKTVTKIVKCNDENKFLVGTDVGLFELYFDINDNPIFTSVFQGKVEDVLYSNKKILLLSSGEVFYKSIEDTEWKKLPLPIDNSKILKLDYKPDNNVIYIITGDMELYRTLNFGNTWDLISKLPLEGLNIFTFYVEKTDQNLMFIGTDVGLYKSKDGGENFYESDNGLENTWISSFINDPYNSKKYYLSTWGGKIYYSEDSGNTWNPLGNDFQNYTYEINLNFDYPWILYAATQKGLYYFNSVNGWTVASNELEDSWVKTIASSKDKIVIGTLNGEIYYFEKNKYIELCRPNNLSYEKIDTNTIKLTWNVESLENIAGFIIYMKDFNNQSFKPIKIVKVDNRYSVIKVDNPQEIFTIKAFNSDILPTTSDFSPILEVELHETEDNSPPQLLVYIPEKTSNPELEISGEVIDKESGVKYLKINGVNVSISSNGSFSYTITLKEGENTITFEAEDTRGNKTKKTFTVRYVKEIILKFQIGNRVMLVNDTQLEMDVAPTIIEGRTLLPIRYVAEPLGAIVGWDGYERKVTVSLGDVFIELWIGKSTARVNGVKKPIDPNNPKVTPMIINGRTMLPLRFVAENVGCRVEWNGVTRTVTIIYQEAP